MGRLDTDEVSILPNVVKTKFIPVFPHSCALLFALIQTHIFKMDTMNFLYALS